MRRPGRRGRIGGLGLALATATVFAGCGGGGHGDDDDGDVVAPDAGVPFTECDASDQAFVRSAYLALLGRRPRSQAEVDVYVDVLTSARALADAAGGAPEPREVVARAILAREGYVDRWTEHFMDALRIARIEDQSQASCYGIALRSQETGVGDGALAAWVRDHDPVAGAEPGGEFSMLDLLRSALHLDDVSVVYRAHLFALMSRAIPAANVPPVEAELARREDFGQVFDSAYLNRDLVCLGCHNSQGAVTDSEDPARDRHFPLPGHLERSLYGSSSGIAPARGHAAFRYDGLVGYEDSGGLKPWGLTGACGEFTLDGLAADPAAVDGKFGSLSGDRMTVFGLERALARGVGALADSGLVVAADGTVADPDQAFAYLVAMSVVESVWREVVGSPLTIANYFPRNQAASDVLRSLSDELVKNRFSLRELLVDIVTSDYFARLPPEAGCGTGPYNMPPIYDPWVTSDADEARRQNGPADAVVPLSARTLARVAFEANEWPRPTTWAFPLDELGDFCESFYTCEEMTALCQEEGTCCDSVEAACNEGGSSIPAEEVFGFQQGIGVFLKNGQRGFRGLDFQARLVWENVFGACRNLGDGDDFIARLVARAVATPAATVGDVVAALKDRLVGQARVEGATTPGGASEEAAIAALIGAPLATPVVGTIGLEEGTRALCGVLMSSPQFLTQGLPAPDSAYRPILTDPADGYAAVCASVAERGLTDGLVITCEADSLSVAAP